MFPYCLNHLLVTGPGRDVRKFDQRDWRKEAGARHLELMQIAPGRLAWQFETLKPPLPFLRSVSRQWPRLTFLLTYDREDLRLKGLVKARNGRLRSSRFTY